MPWLIVGYLLLLFVGAAVGLGLAAFTWRRRPAPGMAQLTGWLLAVSFWMVCYLLFLVSPDTATQTFWYKLQHLGSVLQAPLALITALHYTGQGRRLTWWLLVPLALEPPLTWLIIATNDAHGLFWTAFQPAAESLYPPLVTERGPWGRARLLYANIVSAAAVLLLIISLRRASPLYRRQTTFLILSPVFPWAGTFLSHSSGLNPFGQLDVTQGGYALTFLVWALAILRRNWLDIVPVARSAIIEDMPDAVMVIHAQGHVVDANPAAVRLLGRSTAACVGRPAQEVLAPWPALLDRLGVETPAGVVLDIGPVPRSFEFHITPWRDGQGRLLGWLIVGRDVTDRRQAQELSVLHSISSATNQSLQVAEVLHALLRLLAETLALPAGWVFLYDEGTDRLRLHTSWGLPERLTAAYHTCSVPDFTCPQAVREQRTVTHTRVPDTGGWLQTALCFPLLAQGEVQGVVEVFSVETNRFGGAEGTFFTVVGQDVGAAIRNARLYEQVDAGRQELQRLSQQLVEVQEQERRYLAAELHDEVGQSLTALRMALARVETGITPAAPATRSLHEAQSLVNDLIQKVRALSLDLRPAMLDDLGLLPALLWLCDRYTAQTQIRVAFNSAGLEGRLPAAVETAAFRVVQEALTNVARYAGVAEVQVRVWADGNALTVQVEDRGVGFVVEEVWARAATSGLAGMQQRVAALGGQFIVDSAPGQGTVIWAEAPLVTLGVNAGLGGVR